MATNLKGKGRFVSLLLLHGEKIAIGIVALISLMFIYKAIYLPRLGADFQADKLQAEITKTSSEIKDFTWDRAVTDHPDKVKKFQAITAKGDGTVDPTQYINRDADNKPVFGIDRSIVAPIILRKDPVIINAIDVRATGGSGLFAFVDEKIRQAQQLKMAEKEKEAEKKALDKQKRDQLKAKDSGGPGGRRGRGDGPEGLAEPIDKDHPKRHLIQSGIRPTGNSLQGGERIERAYWACVVAKVPIREQLKLYQDALEKARGSDPNKDFPSYVGFYVERAEVLPGQEPKWDAVPLYDGQQQSIATKNTLTMAPTHGVAKRAYDGLLAAAASFWAGGMTPDVVDARYAEYPLTLPLPPLVGREWGAEASHPDIPWGPFTPVLENEIPQAAPEAAAQPGTDTGGEFGQANPTQPQGGPGMSAGFGAGRPGGPGGFPGGGFGRGMGPEGGPGMMRPGMGGPGMGPGGGRFGGPGGGPEGGPGGMRSSGPTQTEGHQTLQKGVDYYLLRFFDFSVEPGKKYKYRVKLVIQDPNYNMDQRVLEPAVLDRQVKEAAAAKKKKSDMFYRIVDKWSDPSPAVGIPMAGTVHLAETKIPPAEKFNDEPVVKMIVEAFDADEAGTPIQGVKEMDFRRGYVANAIGDARYQPDPTMVDTQSNFKFFTGMTLLDVDGGGKLAKDMTYPARVLVMGPAGELYIRNDSDDKTYVQTFHATFDETTDKHGNPLGPEGPGGPGGPRRPQPRR